MDQFGVGVEVEGGAGWEAEEGEEGVGPDDAVFGDAPFPGAHAAEDLGAAQGVGFVGGFEFAVAPGGDVGDAVEEASVAEGLAGDFEPAVALPVGAGGEQGDAGAGALGGAGQECGQGAAGCLVGGEAEDLGQCRVDPGQDSVGVGHAEPHVGPVEHLSVQRAVAVHALLLATPGVMMVEITWRGQAGVGWCGVTG
ncbi:hypothetical protein Q5530_23495 [Saccharothrix sp. BKS2]|uniref:hypothetical protein n=1 Tax=Saccharothrix sp. BKS2 TaxID=3064400 RepID=UPI0039E9EA86